MKKSIKITLIAVGSFVVALAFILGVAFGVLLIRTNEIYDDYSYIYSDARYQTPVKVEGVEVITQDVSCGYAVIEMFSFWSGGQITEESLYAEYGRVVTSTGDSFVEEFNKRFTSYNTVMYKYLKNSELIEKVYSSLSDGVPVPIEWAAKFEDSWTLHYSLVVGMDIANDTVTVANPYGYMETISLSEFVDRTSFKAFENMPLFYQLAFAFGIFEKNTIFIPTAV